MIASAVAIVAGFAAGAVLMRKVLRRHAVRDWEIGFRMGHHMAATP